MATTVETSNAVTNITVTTGTQNVFSNIATDSGTVVVDSTVDTLTFTGAGGITTSGTPGTDTVTITQGPANLTTKDTDDLSEGSTNLYFTNARADARIAAATIDADSTTIQNLEVDNLKAGVLDTDISSVAGTDTTLASAKAIKTYVDSQILTKDNTDEITEGSTNLYFTNARADARIAAASIDALSDVDTTTAAPTSNQILLWNGSNFVPGDVSSGAGYQSTTVITDLTDHSSSGSFAEGQIFVYDASFPTQFVNRTLSGAITLDGDGVTALAADTVNDTHIDFGTGTNQVNTDDLPEGSTNEYFTNARADARVNLQTGANLDLSNKSTSDLAEGTNLYYTDSRFDTRLATKDTGDLAEGTNLYYTDSRFDTRLGTKTTDNLTEGSSNLYYTDARAQAVSINNLSEDTTPELGGTLDILGNDIKSSTANVVISADANDKNVELKIKDPGGTLQTAATFSSEDRVTNTTAGDSGTATTVYEPILDIPHGIRIGSTTSRLSNTGAQSNPNNSVYGTTGILITNDDRDLWPELTLLSYGGNNPLEDQYGASWSDTWPSPIMNFKTANGDASSPAAIQNNDRMGIIQVTGHDGSSFPGVASAVIEIKANETFSSSNARGAKMIFGFTPTGGAATDGDETADRREQMIVTGDEVKIGNENHDNSYIKVKSAGQELEMTNMRLDLGNQGRIRAATDTDIRLDPQGTGVVRVDTAVRLDNQSGDPSGSGDASHIYAKDVSSSSEVFVRDEAGNVTQISPHNEQGEWQYFSRNIKTGKVVRVNMEKMIRKLEEFTGETFIENE